MLNFSPDHLDRHPTSRRTRAAKARIFENQDAGDWAVINADDPAVLELARRGRADAPAVLARTARSTTARWSSDGWIVDRRADGTRPAGAARRDSSARPASRQRRDGRGDRRRDRRRRAGRDDRGGRRVPRPRARDGAGRRRRRRAVRQRLEGDERRVGAAIDRELRRRSGADHRRPVQGRRPAAAARAARRRARRRSSRSAKRGRCCARRSATSCRCDEADTLGCGGADARTSWRSRQAWCCSRRRARASTCSATTRSADGASRRR